MKFLPTTKEEMKSLGWDSIDVLLISGDTYLDTSYNGSALVGKWLVEHGFKVGIIAQPEVDVPDDITRLGEPNLFFAISGGCVDSMVANYTATKKRRQQDDFTPGGENNKRPDRAVLVYSNMIRRFFKGTTKKIVISGIESSLRRITHYDYWTNKLRKPILFDAKADILSYGMGEMSMLQLANALKNGEDWQNIRGLCYLSKEPREDYLSLPSHADCLADKDKFIEAFHTFYLNCDPITAKGLCQKCDDRYLIQNPPSESYSEEIMDKIYSMEFARDVHPYYKKMGAVRALDTIKYSVTTHRGCYGECNFCAIAIHQGRTIMSRSQNSIVEEVKNINDFRSLDDFLKYTLSYSIFSEKELTEFFKYKKYPVIIRFTYNIALNKRIIRKSLIEDIGMRREQYWGFFKITESQYRKILSMGGVSENLAIH